MDEESASHPRHPGLTLQFPSQGWKQIHTGRKEMLDAFDRARDQAKAHEVEVFHGKVAEAEFRKWLGAFLPKRYAVTAGYVISTGMKSSDKAPHYDVIIYDALESPVLWVEDMADLSSHGRSLAIPVEYVRAVFEVKANFTSATVKDAVDHLADLKPLMSGIDAYDSSHKLHLPANFFCGIVTFELRPENAYSEAAMNAVLGGSSLRGFYGGVILRGEDHSSRATARIAVIQSTESIASTVRQGASLFGYALSQSLLAPDGTHHATAILWSESGFAQFAFDIIALLRGTYKVGHVSSWYGLGAEELD